MTRRSQRPASKRVNVPAAVQHAEARRPVGRRPEEDSGEHLVERGRLLKDLRELRGISQNRLAELAGIDQAQVSKYETGARGMTLTTAAIVARVLGVSLDQLAGNEPLR